jgi:hypothetical protein
VEFVKLSPRNTMGKFRDRILQCKPFLGYNESYGYCCLKICSIRESERERERERESRVHEESFLQLNSNSKYLLKLLKL